MCILQAVLLRSLARNIPSNLWICSEILPGVFQNLEILRNLCQKFGIFTNLFYHLEIFRNLFQNLVIFENLFWNLVVLAKIWRLRNLVGNFAWFRTPRLRLRLRPALFHLHTASVISKANRTLAIIHKCFHFTDNHMFVTLYKSLIGPIIEYGNTIWGPYFTVDQQSIEKVQRTATRILVNLHIQNVYIHWVYQHLSVVGLEEIWYCCTGLLTMILG